MVRTSSGGNSASTSRRRCSRVGSIASLSILCLISSVLQLFDLTLLSVGWILCPPLFVDGLDDLPKGQVHPRDFLARAVVVVLPRPDKLGLGRTASANVCG